MKFNWEFAIILLLIIAFIIAAFGGTYRVDCKKEIHVDVGAYKEVKWYFGEIDQVSLNNGIYGSMMPLKDGKVIYGYGYKKNLILDFFTGRDNPWPKNITIAGMAPDGSISHRIVSLNENTHIIKIQ